MKKNFGCTSGLQRVVMNGCDLNPVAKDRENSIEPED
jgi:hypothetical protein